MSVLKKYVLVTTLIQNANDDRLVQESKSAQKSVMAKVINLALCVILGIMIFIAMKAIFDFTIVQPSLLFHPKTFFILFVLGTLLGVACYIAIFFAISIARDCLDALAYLNEILHIRDARDVRSAREKLALQLRKTPLERRALTYISGFSNKTYLVTISGT